MRKNKSFRACLLGGNHVKISKIGQIDDTDFFTTDTEAFINVKVDDNGFNFDSAELTLVNSSDKSIVVRNMSVGDGGTLAFYEMEGTVISHPGRWRGQIVFNESGTNEKFTSNPFQFDVRPHIIEGKVEKLINLGSLTDKIARFEEAVSGSLLAIADMVKEKYGPDLKGDPISVAGYEHDALGNTLVTFSDGTTITIPKGKDGAMRFEDLTQEQIDAIMTGYPNKQFVMDTVSNIASYAPGKNLFDKDAATRGQLLTIEGRANASDSYFALLDPIDLEANTEYTINKVRMYQWLTASGAWSEFTNTGNNDTTVTFTTPNEPVKLYISGSMTNLDTTQIEKGNTVTEYEPYGLATYKLNDDLELSDGMLQRVIESIPKEEPYEIGEGEVTPENTSFITKTGIDLLDINKVKYGEYNHNGTIIQTSGFWHVLVPVKVGMLYYINSSSLPIYASRIVEHDENMNVIQGFYEQTGIQSPYEVTNPAVKYVDISFRDILKNTESPENVMIHQGEASQLFEKNKYMLNPSIRLNDAQIETGEVSTTGMLVKQTNDDIVITYYKDGDILSQEMNLKGSANGGFTIIRTTLNGAMIHATSDDITPIRTHTTVGANHGYPQTTMGEGYEALLKNNQLYPSVKNLKQMTKNEGNKFTIIESYEILDSESIKTFGADYVNQLDQVESVAKLITTYTFYGFGKCNVSTTLIYLKDTVISKSGFLQSNKLADNPIRYIPSINAIGDVDFSQGVDLSTYSSNLLVTDEHLKQAGQPPLAYTDMTSTVQFTMGYIPEEQGDSVNRTQNTNVYWDLRGTGKSYPVALDEKISPVTAGTVVQVSGFRNYSLPDSSLTAFETVDYGEYVYIYIFSISENAYINKFVDIDSGKTIEEVRNNGVTMLTQKTGGGGITFSTAPNSYAVFKIKK